MKQYKAQRAIKAVNEIITYKFLENEQVIPGDCVRIRKTLQPMPVPELQPSAQRKNEKKKWTGILKHLISS